MNIFEIASKNKYRFNYKGVITTEELWDLSLKELDMIWKDLNSKIKRGQEESLMRTVSKEDKVLENKAAIVKYIFDVKQDEQIKAEKRAERHAERQKLLTIKYEKENEALKNSSIEEIEAKLAELDAEEDND